MHHTDDRNSDYGVAPAPVRNAIRCGICQAPADKLEAMYRCEDNPAHIADIQTGIFSDLTYPERPTLSDAA